MHTIVNGVLDFTDKAESKDSMREQDKLDHKGEISISERALGMNLWNAYGFTNILSI